MSKARKYKSTFKRYAEKDGIERETENGVFSITG